MATLKQSLVFLLKWTLVGLAIACAILIVRSTIAGRTPPTDRSNGTASGLQPDTNISPAPRRSFADAVARAAPAVVNIHTARVVSTSVAPGPVRPMYEQNLPAVRRRVESSLGSGVIVDAAGHIVTNLHVIRGAAEIRVQLADGRVVKPIVVGTDADTDLAVLQIELSDLPVMPLGRSDELRPGDVVLAIGNPLGLSQTVTQGIVSAIGRGSLRLVTFADFIQTDAAINFGNSGGALIDADGDLIGINTAVLAQQLGTEGIGFAIPVNLVRGVIGEIIEYGRVRRGWLGVHVVGDTSRRFSAPVIGVIDKGSPAERAGLRPGDLILELNGKPILTDQEALTQVAATLPGSEMQIRFRRGQQTETVTATLEQRPADDGAAVDGPSPTR
ncbi:MAG TPA: trypsin-like peptidase domain-containing protein [Povalibacter sp.]|uniref:S1C family serine protease n=1 Tax=Povalibacter sp. TaxID=1962978 RepID=UPI002CCEFA63|nr:trypsin-like peptidase domain-containing protein [Povalibacter sp.]HMN45344.1 trypsin-like peptidase domain-containing protein [Povalibacter sp.]